MQLHLGLARSRALSFLLSTIAAVPATAQQASTGDSAKVLSPTIVTAARREERRTSAVVSATVITRSDIDAAAATDVAAALSRRGGLQVAGGTPAGSAVFIEGLGDQRVLVLLDGQPLTGRIGGSFDLSRLPTASVERIEIVQGPQSVLYGSDALGGVINIISRRPRSRVAGSAPMVVDGSVTGGSHGRLDLSTGLSYGSGTAFGARADIGRRSIDLAPGVAADAGARAERWDFAPNVSWRPSATLRVDAGGLGILEQQRYRSGQLYTFSDNTQGAAHIGAEWKSGAQRLVPTVSFSSFNHLSRAATTARPASDSGARDIQRLAKAELGYTGVVSGMILDAGGEVRRESISSDRVEGRDRSLGGTALYGQATYTGGPLSLMPGGRVTWSDAWGTSVTPRLAALVKPLGDDTPLALRASVGRGFRAPDFKELYLNFVNAAAGYAVRGNTALRPERSTNVAASADWTGAGLELRAGGFHNRFENFIETIGPDATGTFTYANVARGTTSGVQLEATRAVGIAELSTAYDYLRTRDDATGGPLLGRATHSAHATAGVTPARGLRANVTLLYTGEAPAARGKDGAVTATRGAFTQLNARVAHRIGGGSPAELFAGADNILAASPGTGWPGFTGRQVYAGASWSAK